MPQINTIVVNGVTYTIGGSGGGDGMSAEAKSAVLTAFENVAWASDVPNGSVYIENVRSAFYPPANLSSISASYTQSGTVREGASVETLRSDLTVTAIYENGTTEIVTSYTLSGELTEGPSTVTVMYGGKTTTFTVSVTGMLPSEYQKVEYIQSTGTQYIITDIRGNDNNYLKYEIKFYHGAQATSAEDLIYGAQSASTLRANYEIGFSNTANRLYAYSSSSAEIIDQIVNGTVCDLTVTFSSSSPYATMKLTDGTKVLTSEKTTANSLTGNETISILGHMTAAHCRARIYSLKAYNSSGLFMNMIPCYRKSDGEIGMYELVTSQFFTNNGTGTFLKGADI